MKHIRPMILVFVALTAFLVLGKSWLQERGVDQEVLIIGNLVLFIVSLVSFVITFRSINVKNTHAFIRAIYGGFVAKFFLLVIAAFVYAMVAKSINKPALFGCMALYIVYAFLEVKILLGILKKKTNA
jgi:uncharacterized membrane-anchored protein